ncbi:tRNA (32-2'-O)-methyltransferase regulator THADA-like [Liolophura sinensis]|uniref:tRNA (32-2'-O)-methyltransferase regulator THADA-like n=1 Tax=Liolophura sinensis TaxID=3198878 RepID=UPI003159584C
MKTIALDSMTLDKMAEVATFLSSPDSPWLQRTFPDGICLFKHLLSDKRVNADTDPLVKRLKTAQKCLHTYLVESGEITHNIELEILGDILVSCMWSCAENIRLGREIEKLLEMMRKRYPEIIKPLIKSRLESGVFKVTVDSKSLNKVSCVLDQSSGIRDICKGQLSDLLNCLLTTLTRVTRAHAVGRLTKSDQDLLYTVIKVCLQVFQYYSDDVSPCVWTDVSQDTNGDLQLALENLLTEMVYILRAESFSSDCVLLTGSAVMFLLNTAPTSEVTGFSFWTLLHQLDSKDEIHIGHLILQNKDTGFFQSNTKETSCDSLYRLGHLSLLRGFVTSAETATLLSHNSGYLDHGDEVIKGDNYNLVRLFQPILHFCKGPVNLQYLAFQALSKWYKKVLQIINKGDSNFTVLENLYNSSVLSLTWDLIQLNCDSPVDNVAEFCVEICSMLLELEQLVKSKKGNVTKGGAMAKELTDVILDHVVSTSWTVKSRYKLLKVVLSFVSFSKIEELYSDLATHLLQCLSTSTLAVSATDVYRACLIQIRSGAGDIGATWTSQWWNFMEQAVTSDLSLLRQNAMVYLVPTTLKALPDLSECILTHITTCLENCLNVEHRNRVLLAWVSVAKVIRSLISGFKVPEETLSEAAFHSNDDVRSAAFGILCTTLKTAEPLSLWEDLFLRKTLPLNLNVDSAAFRQRLMGDVKKLAIRCRDSGLALVKSAHKNKDSLTATVDFVDWLLELCMTNLHPGVSFQRRKTCLEIFQVLLQIFKGFHESKHKKGQDQENMNRFMLFCKEMEKMDFCCTANWLCILHCVVDGTDEVQNLANTILMKYFPPSLLEDSRAALTTEGAVCQILSHGLQLCNTAWSPNNNSGSLLCQYVWNRYICGEGLCFDIDYQTDTNHHCVRYSGKDKAKSPLKFIQFVIRDIQEAVELAGHSPLVGADSRPIQGMFNLLNSLLSEKGNVTEVIPDKTLEPILENVVRLSLQTTQLMSDILTGGDNSDTCVSFADITTSLANLLPSTTQTLRDVSSSDYRPLLTWCANNTKESCICVGRIVEMFLLENNSGDCIAQLPWLQRLGDEFLSVFIRHRHWGAIDGCRVGFTPYCTALFSSSNAKFCCLPKQLLAKVLENLTSNSAASSVTRRSGGLPVLIQTVIVSEKIIGQTECLSLTLSSLLSVAASPLPTTISQTQDLPQVHAINMLNTLFSDAGLVHLLVSYISSGMVLVINSFSSQSWAVRNSATQLFSTLISRMFGQKKSGTDSSSNPNSMTITEFSAHYPKLCPLIVTKLEAARKAGFHSVAQLPPVLFPILTILSHLAPQTATNSFVESVRDVVCQAAYSPVYSLRELAAKAFPALLQPCERQTIAEYMLHRLSISSVKCRLNYVHGILQQVDKLLDCEKSSDKMASSCLNCLLKSDWLIFDADQSCDFVKAMYMEVMLKCWVSLHSETKMALKEKIQSFAEKCLLSKNTTSTPSKFQIGEWLFSLELMKLLFSVFEWDDGCLQQIISTSLHSTSEMRPACVQCLKNSLKSRDVQFDNKPVWLQIKVSLFQSLRNYGENCMISECLDLIVDIHERYGPSMDDPCPLDIDTLTWTNDLDPSSILSAQFLEMSAICIRSAVEKGCVKHSELDVFSEKLELFTGLNGTNRQQMAAARSLCITGCCILTAKTKKNLELPITRLIMSTFNLLHSIQPDVRAVAGQFVSRLPRRSSDIWQHTDLQTAVCIQVFCEFVIAEFSWSDHCILRLCARLYEPGVILELLDQPEVSTDSDTGGRELGVEGKYLHGMLLSILQNRANVVGLYLCAELLSIMEKALRDLEGCCQFLSQSKEDNVIFPALASPETFTCLTRLLLFADLSLTSGMVTDADVVDRVEKSVQKLSQVRVLCLKPFLGEILQKILVGQSR